MSESSLYGVTVTYQDSEGEKHLIMRGDFHAYTFHFRLLS